MKRIAISALALALLAGPTAQAMAAEQVSGSVVVAQYHGSHAPWAKSHDDRHHRWYKGQRYPEWKRHKPVREWHRYGLRRPAPGHQWIRVGNDYLLVSVVSGMIAGIAAAH